MPPNHGVGFHDQDHFSESPSIECAGEHRQDRPVGLAELRASDLSLKDRDLVAQREDLRVSFVAGREDPSEPSENEPCEGSEDDHDGGNVPTPTPAETSESGPDEYSAPTGSVETVSDGGVERNRRQHHVRVGDDKLDGDPEIGAIWVPLIGATSLRLGLDNILLPDPAPGVGDWGAGLRRSPRTRVDIDLRGHDPRGSECDLLAGPPAADVQRAIGEVFEQRVNPASGHTHCVPDALLIPALRCQPATIRSTSPRSGRTITIAVTHNGFTSTPVDAVISLGVAAHASGTVYETTCPYINAFDSIDDYDAWTSSTPDVVSMAVRVR